MLTIRSPFQPHGPKSTYVYRHANCDYYRHYVTDKLNINLLPITATTTDSDRADAHLTDTINSVINKSTPLRAWKFMTTQIATSKRLLIQERNKLRILWQRTHNIALRPRTNALKEETDRAIKTQLCNNWHQILQNPTSNTRWFKYGRDWFVCKQAALRSSCATLTEWRHNLHSPSCSG